jgi:transposase
MAIASFLEGRVRALEWLGGVPRECVYDNLRRCWPSRSAQASRRAQARQSLREAVAQLERPPRRSATSRDWTPAHAKLHSIRGESTAPVADGQAKIRHNCKIEV